MKTSLVALLAALIVVAVAATEATATAPGKNGSIVYRTYFDLQHSRGAIFTMGDDGSAKKQISHPPRGTVDDQPAVGARRITRRLHALRAGLAVPRLRSRPDGSGTRQLGKACAAGAREHLPRRRGRELLAGVAKDRLHAIDRDRPSRRRGIRGSSTRR